MTEGEEERETEDGERREEELDTGEAHTQQPVCVKYMLTWSYTPNRVSLSNEVNLNICLAVLSLHVVVGRSAVQRLWQPWC